MERKTCSCGAAIEIRAHHKTGKPAPVTVERFANGNVVPLPDGTYRIRGKAEPVPPGGLPVNHWSNCPTWGKKRP